MSDTLKWERQPSDTTKSYEAFRFYRDMGAGRALEKARKKLGKKSGYMRVLEKWSSDHNWQERVAAWDEHQDKLRSERYERKRLEVEDHTLADYEFMRKAIEKRVQGFADVDYAGKPNEYHELLSLMKRADDYVRRALGLPDKITESKNIHSGDADNPIIIQTGMDMDDL